MSHKVESHIRNESWTLALSGDAPGLLAWLSARYIKRDIWRAGNPWTWDIGSAFCCSIASTPRLLCLQVRLLNRHRSYLGVINVSLIYMLLTIFEFLQRFVKSNIARFLVTEKNQIDARCQKCWTRTSL